MLGGDRWAPTNGLGHDVLVGLHRVVNGVVGHAAFDNAIRADMAIGGSTNAIVHLVAIAGRAGIALPLRRFCYLISPGRTPPVRCVGDEHVAPR